MNALIRNGIWVTKAMVMNWGVHTYVLYDPIPMSGAALTGDNRTGKSTLIDALLTVLTGSTSGKNYNRAASGNGKQGKRRFKNYMTGKKEGTDGPGLRGASAFTTHLAIEFFDRLANKKFVFGISSDYNGPEDADSIPHITWYSYEGALDKHLYVSRDSTGRATSLSTSDLRRSLKLLSDGQVGSQASPITQAKIYTTAQEYQNTMANRFGLSDTSYLRTLCSLSSVSQNMRFSDFIFNNLCGTTSKIDVSAMNSVLDNWKDISDRYDKHKLRQEAISKEIEAYAKWAADNRKTRILRRAMELNLLLENKREIADRQQRLQSLECELRNTQTTQKHIDESIRAIVSELEGIMTSIYSNDAQATKHRYVEKLEQAQNQYSQHQSTVTEAWKLFSAALDRLEKLIAAHPDNKFLNLGKYYELATELNDLGREGLFAEPHLINRLIASADDLIEEISNRHDSLQGEQLLANKRLDEAQRKLDTLCSGAICSTPDTTKLVAFLKAQGLHAASLAEALDIASGEDAWRGPIEAILGRRREDILVPVREFDLAWTAYKSYRGNKRGDLVASPQIYSKMKGEPIPEGTLASKVIAIDGEVEAVARAYATFLLGKIYVATSIDEARKNAPERSSVTVKGEYYHAYRISTLQNGMFTDFQIGKEALLRRTDQEKQNAIQDIKTEKRILEKCREALNELGNLKISILHKDSRFALQLDSVLRAQEDADHLSAEISGLRDAIGLIDTSDTDELNSRARELQNQKERCQVETRECSTKIGQITTDITRLKKELEDLCADLKKRQAASAPLEDPDEENDAVQASQRSIDSLNLDCSQAKENLRESWQRVILERDHCRNHMPANDIDASSTDNTPWLNEYETLSKKLLPTFRSEVAEVEKEARRSFVNDVAGRLGSIIQNAQKATREANRLLRDIEFGDKSYRFTCRKTADPFVAPYYNMVTSSNFQQCSGGLWGDRLLDEFKDEAEGLFRAMRDSRYGSSESVKKDASTDCKKLLDVSNYLEFEMIQVDRDGTETRLTEGLEASSGGEAMLPLYLVLLAGLARTYRTNSIGPDANTLRLVLIDEAFDKIDNRSAGQALAHIHRLGLQPILATPGETLAEELMMGTGAAFLHFKTEEGAYAVCHSNEKVIGDNLDDRWRDQ